MWTSSDSESMGVFLCLSLVGAGAVVAVESFREGGGNVDAYLPPRLQIWFLTKINKNSTHVTSMQLNDELTRR